MNIRKLAALAIALGLVNPITAIITSVEHVRGSEPAMLAVFAVPWFVGAWLLMRGRVMAGAIVVGLLALLDLVSSPTWKRTTALDWTVQALAVLGALVGLATVVAVLVRRHRAPAALAEAAR